MEDIMLSKINQTQKDRYYMTLYDKTKIVELIKAGTLLLFMCT